MYLGVGKKISSSVNLIRVTLGGIRVLLLSIQVFRVKIFRGRRNKGSLAEYTRV